MARVLSGSLNGSLPHIQALNEHLLWRLAPWLVGSSLHLLCFWHDLPQGNHVCYVLKMVLVVYLWLSYRQAPHSLRPVIYLMRSNIRLLVNRCLSTAQSTCHTDWATDKNWQYQECFLASHQNNLLFDIKEKKRFGQTFNKHRFYYHIFLPIYHCMARAVWKFSPFHVEMNMKYFALFSVSGLVLFFF